MLLRLQRSTMNPTGAEVAWQAPCRRLMLAERSRAEAIQDLGHKVLKGKNEILNSLVPAERRCRARRSAPRRRRGRRWRRRRTSCSGLGPPRPSPPRRSPRCRPRRARALTRRVTFLGALGFTGRALCWHAVHSSASHAGEGVDRQMMSAFLQEGGFGANIKNDFVALQLGLMQRVNGLWR